MAKGFNLTAEINLRGPANLKTIAAQIRRELGVVTGNVKLNIDPKSAKGIDVINKKLNVLNTTLVQARQGTIDLNVALSQLGSTLSSMGNSTVNVSGNMTSASTAAASTAKNINVASSAMENFGRQSALAIKRFAAFSVVTSGVYALVNAINSGFRSFIEFDKQMIRLQQVTGQGALGLKGLEAEIGRLSVSLGISSEELANVAITLAQAGITAEDTRVALSALAKTELAPSFENLTQTTEGAIAAIRQFGLQAAELEGVLGSINAVAAAFAVESSDIIAAIQRTGGVFASASKGVSEGADALNEFIAVFTSVRATTRESAETIATGLRTIFTRIQRADTIRQLKDFGVELTDLEGKFVGPFEAIKRLSEGLRGLDPRDLRFSSIVEELGGFRQIGKVLPLIQQFETAQKALAVAQKGQNSLTDAQAIAQKSLAVQLAQVRAQFVALIRDVGKSTAFQTLFTFVIGLSKGLLTLANAFKPILPLLGILAAFKGAKALTEFAGGFFGSLKGAGGARGVGSNIGGAVGGAKDKERADTTAKAAAAVRDNTSALQSLTTTVQSLENAIKNLPTFNSGGRVYGFNKGGSVPGSGRGDKVPAMLEPQEFVVSRKGVQAAGRQNLEKLNRGRKIGRFARGGVAQIGSIDEITDVRDGDTFSAMVTPTVKPYEQEFRIAEWDAWEKPNRKNPDALSTTTATKYKEIKSIPENKKLAKLFDDKKKRVPGDAIISEGRTAVSLATGATQSLRSTLKSIDKKELASGILSENDFVGRRKIKGIDIPDIYKTGRTFEFALGGLVQKFARGGKIQRNLGYIDYDIIANEANAAIVEEGMKKSGVKGPRLYAEYLTDLAVKARKEQKLDKLRAIYGVAGSGKTTLARGQGTDIGTLRETTRFPILTPEDIDKASEVLILTSSVSRDKLEGFLSEVDRAYTLSSTTASEQERIKAQRASRDVTGVGLEGRTPGTTTGVSRDTAVGEALLGDALGKRSTVLGRSASGRLRQKKGNELVEIIKKRIGFTWGGFAPTTRGHESIVDSAAAYGIPPEDFIALVGSDEGITDPKNFRTAILDQDARVLLAKAGFGAKGATVLPKPRDFEVPQGFDIGVGSSGRRQVVLPTAGSTAFMADKTEKDFQKYIAAGYKTVNLPRSEGISGTQVRELIAAGDLASLQGVLSPGVYDMISRNIGRIQNRAGVLPNIIAEVEKSKSLSLEQLEQQIKAIGIARVSSKKVAEDPEYAAKVEVLKELRAKRDKIKGAAEFEPFRLLAKLAAAQPDKYGLDFSPASTAPDLASMTGVESIKTAAVAKNMGGLIQNFMAGGVAKKVRKTQASMNMAGSKLISEMGGMFPAIKALEEAGIDLGQGVGKDERARTMLRSDKKAKQVLIDAINAKYAEFFGGISQQGLSFGAVAMQGNEYTDQAKEISNGLKQPTTVSITGRLISDKFRQMLSEDISGGYQSAIVNPAQRLTISQILEDIIGGDKLISDFDKVINYGADVIPSSPGAPMFSEFSDLDKVREALGSSRLSPFGESLVDLVKSTNSGELLNRMFINTARSQATAPLIKEWLDSVGLPIPLENIYGVGGANVGGSSIPRLKAAIVQTLGGGTFVDDDPANVGAVDEAMRSAGLAGKSYLMPFEATAGSEVNTAKGVLFQNILANLGAFRNPDKQSIDFPNGLGSQAAGLVNDGGMFVTMPTDAKYTLSGPSDLVSNITNYLKAQGYMAGGVVKAAKQPFGTGEFPFPKRISNAYFKEIDKILEAQRNRDVWDINPKDERIIPDVGVVQSGYDMPFDKGMFLTTFRDKISKNNLFTRMGQFARFIGLPGENLSAILPQQIDFGAPGMLGGALFTTDPSGPKTRGLQGVDLSQYGFSERDKQDVFGYGKLLEEKEKAIKKVLKTPVKTFEDGSFQYDKEAAQSLWAEIDEIKGKISAKAKLQRDASDKARAARMKIAETTGRGGVSVDQNLRGQTQNYDVLYHELTHQLFQSMRVRNAESFTKYKDRVNSLFAGDNDDLAQAFDSLTEYGYKSADVVYGRSYKQNALQGMALNIYRKANESKSQEDKDFATNVAKGLTSSQGATTARAYRPINPNINSLLLKGNVSQDAIDRMEDNGKEEFLTTLLQYAPKLDDNLSGILDSTLTDLLGNAGIQRQRFAAGGVAKKKNFGKIALRIGDRIQATYIKEGEAGASRSGQVIADKINNSLYAVQSSAATKGYGPKLYDVVMEAVTAQGGMLTSDRKTVSDSAKAVWDYYFKNRSDVTKTPLDPTDWVSNSRLLDPKLYGKPETWPPPTDPAWVLQSGYSKSPSDINNPDLVQKLARGGSSSTVPAMLTPGEAVIGPQTAKRIGYGKLARMNHADKNSMGKYSGGGDVSIVPGRGNTDSFGPVGLPVGSFVIRKKATEALGFNKGGTVGINKLFTGGRPTFSGARAADDESLVRARASSQGISFNAEIGNIRKALIDAAKQLTNVAPKKEALRLAAIENREKLNAIKQRATAEKRTIDADPTLDPAEKAKLKREVDKSAGREFDGIKAIFADKIREIDPRLDLDQVENAAKNLTGRLINTTDGFDTIVASSSVLQGVFNTTISETEALSIVQRQQAEQLGISTDSLRNFASAADVARENLRDEQEKNFGQLGRLFPELTKSIQDSGPGQQLVNLADSFSMESFSGMLDTKLSGLLGPALGSGIASQLSGLIGGLGGPLSALGAAVSVVGETLPALGGIVDNAFGTELGKSPTFAGVVGGVQGAGQYGASGAALGAQVGGPVGALIGGISGAIYGAIRGSITAALTKELENGLNKLTESTAKADKAMEELGKNNTFANIGKVQSAVGEQLQSAKDLEKFAAPKTTNETFNPFTEGFWLSSQQQAEALSSQQQALVKVLESNTELARTVAERFDDVQLDRASANAAASVDPGTFAKNSVIVDQYTRALIKQRGGNILASESIEEYASKLDATSKRNIEAANAEARVDAATAAYINNRRQLGDSEEEARRKLDKGGQKALDEGMKLVQQREEEILKAIRLQRAVQKATAAQERLLELYKRMGATVARLSTEINKMVAQAEAFSAAAEGNASVREMDTTTQDILSNISGYSMDEVRGAGNNVAALLGNTPEAQQFGNAAVTAKVIQDQLPGLLASTEGRDVDAVVGTLETQLRGLVGEGTIDPATGRGSNAQIIEDALSEVRNKLEAQGDDKTFEQLSRDAGFLKQLSDSAQAGLQAQQEIIKAYNDGMNQAINVTNKLVETLTKADEYFIKAGQIRIDSELELKEALGQTVSLNDRNRGFETEVRSLTRNIVPGGTLDVGTILNEALRRGQETSRDMPGPAGSNTREMVGAMKSEIVARQKAAKANNDAVSALKRLAEDGSRAANALALLKQNQQLASNSSEFLRKALTSNAEELADMTVDAKAYSMVAGGTASASQFQNLEFRQQAFRGFDMIGQMLPEDLRNRMGAGMQIQMLEATNPQLLNEVAYRGRDANGELTTVTFRDALEAQARGEPDSNSKAIINEYQKAVETQIAANNALGLLQLESAQRLDQTRNDILSRIEARMTDLVNKTKEQIAAEAAATKDTNKPTVEAKETRTEAATPVGAAPTSSSRGLVGALPAAAMVGGAGLGVGAVVRYRSGISSGLRSAGQRAVDLDSRLRGVPASGPSGSGSTPRDMARRQRYLDSARRTLGPGATEADVRARAQRMETEYGRRVAGGDYESPAAARNRAAGGPTSPSTPGGGATPPRPAAPGAGGATPPRAPRAPKGGAIPFLIAAGFTAASFLGSNVFGGEEAVSPATPGDESGTDTGATTNDILAAAELANAVLNIQSAIINIGGVAGAIGGAIPQATVEPPLPTVPPSVSAQEPEAANAQQALSTTEAIKDSMVNTALNGLPVYGTMSLIKEGMNATGATEALGVPEERSAALDWTQFGLSIAGLVPVIGELADLANAGIYAARAGLSNDESVRNDLLVDAGLSAASAIPVAGYAANAVKFGKGGVRTAAQYGVGGAVSVVQGQVAGSTAEAVRGVVVDPSAETGAPNTMAQSQVTAQMAQTTQLAATGAVAPMMTFGQSLLLSNDNMLQTTQANTDALLILADSVDSLDQSFLTGIASSSFGGELAPDGDSYVESARQRLEAIRASTEARATDTTAKSEIKDEGNPVPPVNKSIDLPADIQQMAAEVIRTGQAQSRGYDLRNNEVRSSETGVSTEATQQRDDALASDYYNDMRESLNALDIESLKEYAQMLDPSLTGSAVNYMPPDQLIDAIMSSMGGGQSDTLESTMQEVKNALSVNNADNTQANKPKSFNEQYAVKKTEMDERLNQAMMEVMATGQSATLGFDLREPQQSDCCDRIVTALEAILAALGGKSVGVGAPSNTGTGSEALDMLSSGASSLINDYFGYDESQRMEGFESPAEAFGNTFMSGLSSIFSTPINWLSGYDESKSVEGFESPAQAVADSLTNSLMGFGNILSSFSGALVRDVSSLVGIQSMPQIPISPLGVGNSSPAMLQSITGDLKALFLSLISEMRGSAAPAAPTNVTAGTGPVNILTIDEKSKQFLESFQKSIDGFGGYVSQLSTAAAQLPDKIEFNGNYNFSVNITGAEAFDKMKVDLKDEITSIFQPQIDTIYQQTLGGIGKSPNRPSTNAPRNGSGR